MLSVFFLDDHQMSRVAVQALLKEHFDVEVFSTIALLKKELLSRRPDVLLLDIGLQEGDLKGIELASNLLVTYPSLKIIFFSAAPENSTWVPKAIKSGARGFIFKLAEGLIDSLIPAINDVSQGQNYVFNKPVFEIMLDNLPDVPLETFRNPLSEEDKKILIAIGNGEEQIEIAREHIKLPIESSDKQFQNALDQKLNDIRGVLKLDRGGGRHRYVIQALKLGYIRLSDFSVK